MMSWHTRALTLATSALLLAGCGGAASPASTDQSGAAAPASTSASAAKSVSLDQLIAQAKQEGELDTATTTEQSSRVPELKDAFLKRFGLSINVNIALGDQTGKFAKMQTTLDAGGRPEFDTLTGSEEDIIQMAGKGYLQPIDNWQELLKAVNSQVRDGTVKAEDVSPAPFTGSSFIWSTRSKALMYNTKVISEDQLPGKTTDLADPKYKGKFTVPPWTDTWELGIQTYTDKDAWLKTLDAIGKNAAGVVDFSPAL